MRGFPIHHLCIGADRRMPDNPLAYLSGLNVKTDRRHDRRALSVEEIDRLIKVTAEGKKHHKMAGNERAMLYMLALIIISVRKSRYYDFQSKE